jgi:hypothetical protein
MRIDPQDASRATLGSLLQTLFGISSTFQKWSHVHNKVVTNYIWAIGNTPFG